MSNEQIVSDHKKVEETVILQPLLRLFRQMSTARRIDVTERDLIARGEAFFHVSGAGHEATAVLARHLLPDDYLHCHYRDKALMLARGISIRQFFDSLLCNGAGHSAGRQMSAHLSDPSHHILSLVGPVGNNALQAVGVAGEIKDHPKRPLVLCSIGDGTAQQGEVLEAVGEAVRWSLPVVFFIQNNRLAISTATSGMTFFSLPTGNAEEFYGMIIHRVDGRDAIGCDQPLSNVLTEVRLTRKPALIVMDVERLSDHTNSDDERVYRPVSEIVAAQQSGDPISNLRSRLLKMGVSKVELAKIESDVDIEVKAAAAEALVASATPLPAFTAKGELPSRLRVAKEFRGDGRSLSLTMSDAIRETLRSRMVTDNRITLYGEDIQDPKGDVFGITRGLTGQFPDRVRNSPISEATIVGTSVGRALAGGRPVAFIQFADFLPLAFNQIATELGSMFWRTNGGWQCPVIIMVACGGYRPGLGPFHAHTYESVIAHVPGIDVAMPSTGADASGILNAAFESDRPTVFFYPKSCLNDRDRMTSADVENQLVPVGKSRIVKFGTDITIVSWGSTVSLCEKTAEALAIYGFSAEIVDLRWLSPWDDETVCKSAKVTGRLLVVHEDNRTTGFGAEVVATVAEKMGHAVVCRRIARADTYIPCNFGNQLEILPSFKSILTAAAEMLDLDITWRPELSSEDGVVAVDAIGSSPADEMVTVAELLVKSGQHLASGDLVASLECDKAVFELASPATGIVEDIFVSEGQRIRVGTHMLTIRSETAFNQKRQSLKENAGSPKLRRRPSVRNSTIRPSFNCSKVGVSSVYVVEGDALVTNEDLAIRFPKIAASEILSLTGIEKRVRVSDGQTALNMAVEAATAALNGEGLRLADLDMIVCSTSTPAMTAPSMACLVLQELGLVFGEAELSAFDLMAACTGYLYSLGAAWDYLQSVPMGRVLVITTEEMSRVVDPQDVATAILFGDAATATVVSGAGHIDNAKASLVRPILSARGENGKTLRVPQGGAEEFLYMDGKAIFVQATRQMTSSLQTVCQQNGISISELDLIIPHQANGRILDAIRSRLRCSPDKILNDIKYRGNTSSNSIPLALASILEVPINQKIGLCAFGAGYTFGAALLQPR